MAPVQRRCVVLAALAFMAPSVNSVMCPAGKYDTAVNIAANFDSALAPFYQPAGYLSWGRMSYSTPSSGTGPSSDHTSGYGSYAFVEASSPYYPSVEFKLEAATTTVGIGSVSFYYHMWGGTMGTLSFETSSDLYSSGYASWTTRWAKSGNQGNGWRLATLSVSSSTVVRVRFRGVTGSSYESDMAIDDISIGLFGGSGSCTTCSAGTSALAGSASCTPCPAGKYSASSGAASCTACVAGKYGTSSSATSSSSCFVCASGKTSEAGASDSSQCGCAIGFYTSLGRCVTCPSGKTTTTIDSSYCVCNKGFYALSSYGNSDTCYACPSGTTTPSSIGGMYAQSCSQCAPGYVYSSSSTTSSSSSISYTTSYSSYSSSSDTRITRIISCKACKAGTYQSASSYANQTSCIECDAGRYAASAKSAKCDKCAGSEAGATSCGPSAGLIVLFIVLAVIGLSGLIYCVNACQKRTNQVAPAALSPVYPQQSGAADIGVPVGMSSLELVTLSKGLPVATRMFDISSSSSSLPVHSPFQVNAVEVVDAPGAATSAGQQQPNVFVVQAEIVYV